MGEESHLGVKPPPAPIPEVQVFADIALDDGDADPERQGNSTGEGRKGEGEGAGTPLPLRRFCPTWEKRGLASPLVAHLLVLLSHQVALAVRLEHGDDLGQPLIPHVFQATQNAGLEEHLQTIHTTFTH